MVAFGIILVADLSSICQHNIRIPSLSDYHQFGVSISEITSHTFILSSSSQQSQSEARMSQHRNAKSTDLDDWETDPDYVRDMDEIGQRWGSKRTVGSINMNELIDEVRKDHKTVREQFEHPSQRDHSEGFGGKYGVQHDRRDQSAHDYDYHEKLSKHTSQEIRREVIKSSSIIQSRGGIEDVKRSFLEKSQDTTFAKPPRSPIPPRTTTAPAAGVSEAGGYSSRPTSSTTAPTNRVASPRFEESSTTRRFIKEEKSGSGSAGSKGAAELSPTFKSIQEKIDAFKKEFEDIENKMSKSADLSKIIKKTTNMEKSSNVEYVTRPNDGSSGYGSNSNIGSSQGRYRDHPTVPKRPDTTSPASSKQDIPKASIKSLSERFETLGREEGEDFRRQTEAKRREFFEQIKNQVRETRKELDGFDPIDDDAEDNFDKIEKKMREKLEQAYPSSTAATAGGSSTRLFESTSPLSSQSLSSRPASRISGGDSNPYHISKPKVFTQRETTQEKIISRVVKENDRIIQNETKRNVERSSSFHGSSDEDESSGLQKNKEKTEPNSIRYIDHQLRASPQSAAGGGESPVERLRRENPIVEPDTKGSGLMAKTLYDYDAAESDELSFDSDDLITNIEKVDKGWYKGTITFKDGSKKVGLFPANYVRLLNDSSEY